MMWYKAPNGNDFALMITGDTTFSTFAAYLRHKQTKAGGWLFSWGEFVEEFREMGEEEAKGSAKRLLAQWLNGLANQLVTMPVSE